MSPSPKTPTRRRHPSNVSIIDLSFASPSPYDGQSPVRFSHSRKSSLHTPTTPYLNGSQELNGSVGMHGEFVSAGRGVEVDGLGCLADELAGAWDDEEEYDGELDEGDHGDVSDGERGESVGDESGDRESENTRDSGIELTSSPALAPQKQPQWISPNDQARAKHRRRDSQYGGSDFGDGHDLETVAGMSPGLEARMALVEDLARRGTESYDGEANDIMERIVGSLKELGGMAGVEGGANRLIHAHTALSTNLAHQTRILHSLTFPLLSPLSLPPDPDILTDLLPMLASVIEIIPQPTTSALVSLSTLSTLTADLIAMLNHLSDSLHMSRQTTTTAARRLRSARELVMEMRRDNETAEESERWIERGSWQERLGRRECGGVCRDVVGGFEEVCNGWRERLLAGAETAVDAVA
ncbi:hypothetical protein GP486_002331 [Trichoglossum hirsutum]|uniref:Uncharacterized protein n=1 Tax=Trichoglossum hirsutum TaxID=265104 RepID=A0A9P8LFF1_9PEZI|nr:hypothetical protein GP486_002331 [Trichoglossum hirsutum]